MARAACVLVLVLVSAAADSQQHHTCAAHGGATCGSRDLAPLSKDQALLQLTGAKAVGKHLEDDAMECGAVRRRRRNQGMSACRRRHRTGSHSDLDLPGSEWKCNEQTHKMECESSPPVETGVDGIIGYPITEDKKALGLWCQVDIPSSHWNLKSCPVSGQTVVKVLTYNLFWWNLFDVHHGSDRSAGRLIARTGGSEKYDIMGFQECDDMWRILHDAGLDDREYGAINGGRAIAVAWRKTKWTKLDHDSVDVGEDSHDQYYGKRSAMWVRLQNKQDGKTVFFVNHHGPLKVSQTGGCTGSATALNIMKLISENAHGTDVIILVGDFNAALGSSRVHEMERRLDKVHSGRIFGGVDHIFSNCGSRGRGETHGKGDGYWKSDHEALSATFEI